MRVERKTLGFVTYGGKVPGFWFLGGRSEAAVKLFLFHSEGSDLAPVSGSLFLVKRSTHA